MNELSTNVVRPEWNPFPGIISIDDDNPTISSPNATYDLPFYMTREAFLDVEVYKHFIENAISRFRRSGYYKAYKSYLMSLGLNKCQIFGNIDDEMASLEMHHNFITIHDIALMITEHIINTVGAITTFDLVQLLIEEHYSNNIPIVMLSKTPHQAYHDDPNNFIPPDMTFGKWWELVYKYKYGITIDIARKIILFIQKYSNEQDPMSIQLRNEISSFANYNEYGWRYQPTLNDNVQDGRFNFSPQINK